MGRAPCCSKVGLKRGPWTIKEDSILIEYMKKHGEGQWRSLPKKAGLLRCGKSCRLRWMNYLRPDIKRGNITPEEEELIIKLHRMLGNRWSLIAGRLPGRTDNEIKNYWNTHLRKRIENREFGTNTVGNSKNSIKRNNTNPIQNQKMSEAIEDTEKNKLHVPKPTRFIVPRPINNFSTNQVAERLEMEEDKLDSTWARFAEEKVFLGEIDNDQINYQTMIGMESDKLEKLYSEYLLLLDGEVEGGYASVLV